LLSKAEILIYALILKIRICEVNDEVLEWAVGYEDELSNVRLNVESWCGAFSISFAAPDSKPVFG